ncbi:hypothetical protein YPPY60_3013, partial [Yersinia pestis PY-60]
MFVTFSLRCRS